jgi:hypothetical protein
MTPVLRRALPWPSLPYRPLLAFGIPFALYLLTLAPTVYNLDSAELSVAAATGGIARATGYPLYLLVGRAWTLLPFGDVGMRMNLFSAFCGAGTVLVVERILSRWHVGGWAIFGALGLLATSTFFWSLSLVAEVYTLHTLLMALLILLLLRWEDRPTPARLASVALLFGLSLGHHAATVLLLPGVLWFVLAIGGRGALAPRNLLPALLAGALGLSVYLYLPLLYMLRPAFNYAGQYDATGTFQALDLRQPAALWWLISGSAFRGAMFGYAPAELVGEVQAFAVHLWRAVFAVGLGPGLLGAALLLGRSRPRGGMLLLMFLCSAAFYIDYRVMDKDTMFLPTYVVWALWLGVGLEWLAGWLREAETEAARRSGALLLRGTILATVALSLGLNFTQVNLRDDRSARIRGERVLAQLAPGARLIGAWDTVPVVEYLQLVEGQRPDVGAINRFLIPQAALAALLRAEVGRRPVYVDAVPADLSTAYRVRRTGLLYEILPGRSSPQDLSTSTSSTSSTTATTSTASTASPITWAGGSKAAPQAGHARSGKPQGVVR